MIEFAFAENLVEYKTDALGNDVLDDKGEKILQPSTNPSRGNLELSGVTGDYFRELMPNSRHSYDAHGLQMAVNFLVEIRGLGIGKENWGRRVKTHADVCAEMIVWAAENDQLLLETVEGTWDEIKKTGGIYGEGYEIALAVLQDFTEVRDFDAINLEDLTMTTIPISFWNTQKATVIESRKMPTAYILPKNLHFTIAYNGYETSTDDIINRLATYNGTEIFELPPNTTVDVEEYVVQSVAMAEKPTSFEGYPRYYLGVETKDASVTFEEGAYIIPMDQRTAIITALSLEPDVDGSLFMFNKFGTEWMPEDVLPAYRFIQNNPREVFDLTTPIELSAVE